MAEFRLGELFCGPGGIALGAQNSEVIGNGETFRIVHEWANDIDNDTCETFRRNIEGAENSVFCGNVKDLNIEELSGIDGLAFGFPCNDFSSVGEQKGLNGNYGALYTYGVKAINVHRPMFFVAENVSGLNSSNEGNAFNLILSDLRNCGYRLVPHKYKFEEYGVPQARHRIIIVGIRNDLNEIFRVPAPTHNPSNYRTSSDAILNPPIGIDAINNETTKQSKNVVERLSYILPGQNAFNADIPEHLKLNVKGAKISQIYKKLDPNKPAYTVTGSGGGGTHMYHWLENRALTNRERARLQTFPDNFVFLGTKESVRKQIGMAVPPKGAEIIFTAILKTFAGIEYDHIPHNIDK
jgi:DNA (cytosine-5)-methyltransferase 1